MAKGFGAGGCVAASLTHSAFTLVLPLLFVLLLVSFPNSLGRAREETHACTVEAQGKGQYMGGPSLRGRQR
eukprot:1639096-Pyramimonas_sp.AAC.1